MRDNEDRRRFLGKWRSEVGHYNGPWCHYRGVLGRVRSIDATTDDLKTELGRIKARELFIRACEWAERKGVRVILLAAGTKRLFEENIEELKWRFPKIVFTIGDNGTMLILQSETLQTLEKSGLKPGFAKIAVLGPYGFLGEQMLKVLHNRGYEITGIGPNVQELRRVGEKYSIPTCNSLDAGKFDAIVACTHSEKVRLTADNVDLLRREDRKLLVIDVAEPSNLKSKEFKKVQDRVIRIDSGNAYSPKMKFVLGAITCNILRLSAGVIFGCFAETLAIGQALKSGLDLSSIDWFIVSDGTMDTVETLFDAKNGGFAVPTSRNYGKTVKSFNLNISEKKNTSEFLGQILWKKLASLIL